MLTFYHHPLSPISRRVWLALLEKEIPFEPVIVDLSKFEQFQPEFLTLSPFHHIPVIVEEGFRVIESIAILDYLEDRYPQPSLVSTCYRQRATMRMIQMVTVNELVPKLSKLVNKDNVPLAQKAKRELDMGLSFLNTCLDKERYFGGDRLNLADIVVGAAVPLFARLGVELTDYSALNQWCTNITARQAWQMTNPSDGDFNAWKNVIQRWMQIALKRQTRQHKGS